MRHVRRGGAYVRVVDPAWTDPLSPEYSRRHGGRWNPPGGFGIVYLNSSRALARAQVLHKLEPRGIHPEDLRPGDGPNLVETTVPDDDYVDAVTAEGLAALGLPPTYPRDPNAHLIPHSTCQPIGQRAQTAGAPGIACRSAAPHAPSGAEELAYFGPVSLNPTTTQPFASWFWRD